MRFRRQFSFDHSITRTSVGGRYSFSLLMVLFAVCSTSPSNGFVSPNAALKSLTSRQNAHYDGCIRFMKNERYPLRAGLVVLGQQDRRRRPIQSSAMKMRTATRLSAGISPAIQTTRNALPLTYMVLLALQFAVQPILTQKFAPKTMIRSTYVLVQDLTRVAIAASLLTTTGSWGSALQYWSWQTALITAGVPSALYLVQNFCSLIAYQHLPPITYNVLNQTKTLSAAFWCFLLLHQRQSFQQMVALAILLLSALVMENVVQLPFPKNESATVELSDTVGEQKKENGGISRANHNETLVSERRTYFLAGVLPVLAASLISGLAGALIQRSLQLVHGGSNSLLLTLQMSAFSGVFLIISLLTASPDRQKALDTGSWTTGWTVYTWIPIIVNSLGGVLVGLVTKFSGAVAKGFALIAGMFLSGILQNYFTTSADKRVSSQQWVGGLLAAISIYLHSAYPAVR